MLLTVCWQHWHCSQLMQYYRHVGLHTDLTSAVCVLADCVLCSATYTTSDTSRTGNVMCHGEQQTSRKCSSNWVKWFFGVLQNLWKVTISSVKSTSQERSQHIQTKKIFMKLHIWIFINICSHINIWFRSYKNNRFCTRNCTHVADFSSGLVFMGNRLFYVKQKMMPMKIWTANTSNCKCSVSIFRRCQL